MAIPRHLLMVAIVSVFAASAAVVAYIGTFGELPIGDQEDWAEFGDYLSGTLGSIFGFFSFLALLLTLAYQNEQLSLTRQQLSLSRDELTATRLELERSASANEATAKALAKQARVAVLSTQISALGAALRTTDEAIARRRAAADGPAFEAIDAGGLTARQAELSR